MKFSQNSNHCNCFCISHLILFVTRIDMSPQTQSLDITLCDEVVSVFFNSTVFYSLASLYPASKHPCCIQYCNFACRFEEIFQKGILAKAYSFSCLYLQREPSFQSTFAQRYLMLSSQNNSPVIPSEKQKMIAVYVYSVVTESSSYKNVNKQVINCILTHQSLLFIAIIIAFNR